MISLVLVIEVNFQAISSLFWTWIVAVFYIFLWMYLCFINAQNCKGSDILPYWKTNKLSNHSVLCVQWKKTQDPRVRERHSILFTEQSSGQSNYLYWLPMSRYLQDVVIRARCLLMKAVVCTIRKAPPNQGTLSVILFFVFKYCCHISWAFPLERMITCYSGKQASLLHNLVGRQRRNCNQPVPNIGLVCFHWHFCHIQEKNVPRLTLNVRKRETHVDLSCHWKPPLPPN